MTIVQSRNESVILYHSHSSKTKTLEILLSHLHKKCAAYAFRFNSNMPKSVLYIYRLHKSWE